MAWYKQKINIIFFKISEVTLRLIFVPCLTLTLMISCKETSKPINQNVNLIDEKKSIKPSVDLDKTRQKAQEAFRFCQQNRYNSDFCVLIDFSLHSGVKRLFIWNFQHDSIAGSFMVSHGCGDNPWGFDRSRENPLFSNRAESHCSSLGKYRIGEKGGSSFGIGIKYLLHGLEPSNNNALTRAIVLHSWDWVTDEERYPRGTSEGWGCPAVSNDAMRKLDMMLEKTYKPVLMWIYN
jgi:hypothetical protein